MKLLRRLICSLGLGLLSALPVAAGDPFDEPITARVLQGWTLPDGRVVAAIALDLEPGWKTYWRAPGDTGIPPEFDWSRSRNLSGVTVSWPEPDVFHQNGLRSIGYKNRVVIPLHLSPRTPGKPIRLRGVMDIGVCADVCMPHQLRFDAALDPAQRAPVPVIASALASVPFDASEAGVRSATCRIEPSADGMRITVRLKMPSAGAPEHVVIEPGRPGVWTSQSDVRRNGGWIEATSDMAHAHGGAFSLTRSDVRITVLGSRHAVDIRGCTAG